MNIKKIAQFNYFLMYDKIPHGLNLCKWKISDSPFCKECNCVENSKHFLFDCKPFVKPFWERFTKIVNKICNININITWKHIIIGYLQEYDCFQTINIMLMIATFAVYKARIVNQEHMWKFFIEELTFINHIKRNEIIAKIITIL